MQKLHDAIEIARDLLKNDHTQSAHKAIGELIHPALEDIILQSHKMPEQSHIVHYTKISVLKSILDRLAADDQVSLRAYDSVHLNDPSEGRYLLDILPKKEGWFDQFTEEKHAYNHAYIASFIMDDRGTMNDNLAFWRSYGNEGEGCSLFSPGNVQRSNFWKVLYGEDSANAAASTISKIVDQLISLAGSASERSRESIEERLIGTVWRVLNRVRYLYKSDAYDYERECRYVPYVGDVEKDVQFEYIDQGDHSPRIRHYIEPDDLDVRDRLLVTDSQIMLGPTVSHGDNARYYFAQAVKRAGLVTTVFVSRLPYRRP